MRVRVSWKAEESNSEEVDSSGESPRVRPLFSRQGWLRSSCILPCQLMRACQVIPEPGAQKPSSLWTLGGGGSQVCLRLSALSAVWWSGNGEQRIRNFLVDHFQSVCLHTPTLVCPHCTGFSCISAMVMGWWPGQKKQGWTDTGGSSRMSGQERFGGGTRNRQTVSCH